MENELHYIVHQFAALQHGDCWIGVNFKTALAHLTPAQAALKKGSANSIWQLVHHLTYWRTVVVNRLNGSLDLPPFADLLPPAEVTDAHWKQSLLDFEAAYHQLRHTILHFNIEHLHHPSPRVGQTFYELLMGCLQHDAYHLGQVVILRKS